MTKIELSVKIAEIKKGELPRLKCFHNGIILIVICFHIKVKLFILQKQI
jgi:hypothetical protein